MKQDTSKEFVDFYALLEVAPTAKEKIIRAAYKVKIQEAHPDRNHGTRDAAEYLTKILNKAVHVLTTDAERAKYDRLRHERIRKEQATDHCDDIERNAWETVEEYFPAVKRDVDALRVLDPSVSSEFKTHMIACRDFEHSSTIAEKFRKKYLQSLFGNESELTKFGHWLLTQGHRDAAEKLRTDIEVLGNRVDPVGYIKQIRKAYCLDYQTTQEAEDQRKRDARKVAEKLDQQLREKANEREQQSELARSNYYAGVHKRIAQKISSQAYSIQDSEQFSEILAQSRSRRDVYAKHIEFDFTDKRYCSFNVGLRLVTSTPVPYGWGAFSENAESHPKYVTLSAENLKDLISPDEQVNDKWYLVPSEEQISTLKREFCWYLLPRVIPQTVVDLDRPLFELVYAPSAL